jgi:hypothetical protein
MKRVARLFAAFAALAITVGAVAAAPRSEPNKKAFTISGRVLEINEKSRTVLVEDRKHQKLYLVTVPENAKFKITFGRAMKYTYPALSDLCRKDSVEMRVKAKSDERLTVLQDGRQPVELIASR